ncbi:hypothetical protein CSUI_006254 [Cystoisospora suis]|uniref:Uncharacterized protein n=1 Tax=Cystoisospora suis TaxID=483139 RepID=A0A2C6K1K6_9APIC|nr:hypothetical protein CSUI_006254 [Cystoisospora suis]
MTQKEVELWGVHAPRACMHACMHAHYRKAFISLFDLPVLWRKTSTTLFLFPDKNQTTKSMKAYDRSFFSSSLRLVYLNKKTGICLFF